MIESFIEWVNSISIPWWNYTLAMAWQVSLVVIIITFITVVFKKIPSSYRYGLWLLVLLKLLLPTSTSSITGLGYWFGDYFGWFNQQTELFIPAPQTAQFSNPVAFSNIIGKPNLMEPPPSPSLTLQSEALILWFVVFLILGGIFFHQTRKLKKLINATTPIDEASLLNILSHSCQKLKIPKKISLRSSNNFSSPAVVGWLNPTIIIPKELLSGSENLEPILLHELSHIKRGDVLVNWVQLVLQVLFWYHPLVWFANARIRRERERSCDDLVLTHLSSCPRSYANSLVQIAQNTLHKTSLVSNLIGMAEQGGDIFQRVKMILDSKRKVVPIMSRKMLVSLFVLGLVIIPLSGKHLVSADNGNQKQNPPMEQQVPEANALIHALFVEADSQKLDQTLIKNLGLDPKFFSSQVSPDKTGYDVMNLETSVMPETDEGQISFSVESNKNIEDIRKFFAPLEKEGYAKILGTPKILATNETEAKISITNTEGTLAYMEKIEEGLFKIKTLQPKDSPGIYFSALPSYKEDDFLILEMDLAISKETGRVEVPEAKGLQIGMPIITTRSAATTVRLKENDVVVITVIPPSENEWVNFAFVSVKKEGNTIP